jgi:uncharacterized protein (TIGR02996 family)
MHEDFPSRSADFSRPDDDDAPRLFYADWPEERGDPRAEFLRSANGGVKGPGRCRNTGR